jgi:hypothetical protein
MISALGSWHWGALNLGGKRHCLDESVMSDSSIKKPAARMESKRN